MKVTLPILFNTDETSTLEDAGMKVELKDLDVRNMVFYSINAIGPSGSYPGLTTIHANGDMFLCSLNPTEVESLIETLTLNLVWTS